MNLEDLQENAEAETKEDKFVVEDEDGIQVKVSANNAGKLFYQGCVFILIRGK